MQHVVKYKEEIYKVNDITVGAKDQFCSWVINEMIRSKRATSTPEECSRFERRLMANPPQWTTEADEEIRDALNHGRRRVVPANLQLIRIIMCKVVKDKDVPLTPDVMTDDELTAFLVEKGGDPDSDYMVAMKEIKEAADPKV